MTKRKHENRDRLTPKQREVYEWLVNTHLSIKEIADKLNREYNTVRTHVERIFDRLGVHSRAELILKRNLLQPPPTSAPMAPIQVR